VPVIRPASRRIRSVDEFLEQISEPLFRFLLCATRDRELAADLAQETLLRAWRKRRGLRDFRAARVWVFRIAANLSQDNARRASRMKTSLLDPESLSDRTASPTQAASQQEFHAIVWSAMQQLPERQREVMHLRVVEQLSAIEIADVLRIRAGAVRSSLAEARKHLRVQLSDYVDASQPTEVIAASDCDHQGCRNEY
jgi:RNA polymerase sigma-70 factor (ECF subfamily)